MRDAAIALGAALRDARHERRYSQVAVADVVEMSQPSLVHAEYGRFGPMTVDTLLAIVDRYDLRVTLEPRDEAISRYRAELEQRAARRSQRELEL